MFIAGKLRNYFQAFVDGITYFTDILCHDQGLLKKGCQMKHKIFRKMEDDASPDRFSADSLHSDVLDLESHDEIISDFCGNSLAVEPLVSYHDTCYLTLMNGL
uniref:Uncharacterized protein n=1 Tax=Salix viminalis TaxID=40686 RepID=A0A6N2L903_SALVM